MVVRDWLTGLARVWVYLNGGFPARPIDASLMTNGLRRVVLHVRYSIIGRSYIQPKGLDHDGLVVAVESSDEAARRAIC